MINWTKKKDQEKTKNYTISTKLYTIQILELQVRDFKVIDYYAEKNKMTRHRLSPIYSRLKYRVKEKKRKNTERSIKTHKRWHT